MSCPRTDALLLAALDPDPTRPLTGEDRDHLLACPSCRQAFEDATWAADLLVTHTPTPPPDLTARTIARVWPPPVATRPAPPARRNPIGVLAFAVRRTFSGVRAVSLMVAAAAVITLLSRAPSSPVALGELDNDSGLADLEERVAQLDTGPTVPEGRMAGLLTAGEETDDPDQRPIDLLATIRESEPEKDDIPPLEPDPFDRRERI